MSRFLGSFYCDHCSHGGRVQVWLLEGGSRLCAEHYRNIVGYPPPTVDPIGTPQPEPGPAGPAWTRVVPGLRMRPAAGAHGVELQGVRNLRLGEATSTVGDTAVWSVPDAALVELVLLASSYRDSDEPTKAQVRVLLLRVLHGTERP